MLEIVAAAIILAMVASAIASTFGFVIRLESRNERRLGALEVANRIILQYLDDPDNFAQTLANQPIDYGRYRYRWELRVQSGEFRTSEPVTNPTAANQPPRPTPTAGTAGTPNVRYELLTVNIWGVADYDRDRGNITDGLLATLTRVADPIAVHRNPDAFGRIDITQLLTGSRGPQRIIQGERRDDRFGPGPGVQQ
jgi:type II secretory pathway pseudopilin PulG